jgi:hypothetical protein
VASLLPLCGEGATREEAVAQLRALIRTRLAEGAEVASPEISDEPHPWMEFAGMFKDDPLVDEWKKAVASYRQQVEDDPESP